MLLLLLQVTAPSKVWYEDPMIVATVVIAIATVVNVVATILLWRTTKRSVDITRDMFEASHRPYVGAVGVEMETFDDPKRVRFVLTVKNVGSVPAHSVISSLEAIVDGVKLPVLAREEEPVGFLLPNNPQHMGSMVDDPREVDSVLNASTLSILYKCTYKGVGQKEHTYEHKYTYHKKHDAFTTVRVIAT